MADSLFLEEKDWRNLLRDIHSGQVVPVIGPELITIPHPATGVQVTLQSHLAPLLARQLRLPGTADFLSVNEVACAWLLGGGARKDIYDELREIMDGLKCAPSPVLMDLARIADFDLYITSTFDHQLSRALSAVRPAFDPARHSLTFHPQQPSDVPEPLSGTLLYYILGDYNTYPDFAVWEEDYMEFICGLLEHQDTMERLFRVLKRRHLLLLGAPAPDWIVRFFLRAARQERLSDRSRAAAGVSLATRRATLGEPLVFFFDKLIQATRVIDGAPAEFVQELSRRWQERYGQTASDAEFLERQPLEMPKDAVFISYAHEDLTSALRLARGLSAAGVPVWMDKTHVKAGEQIEHQMEAAIRVQCSYFLSVISQTTEADAARSRYVHRERDWAAARHVEGFLFYLPLAIDEAIPEAWMPRREPDIFSKIHYTRLPGGSVTPDFARYVRHLVESYRVSGRPRV